ncbi:MAG TPA: efflux RND transporter periplasmic adaptor subunit [Candidatus Acidoferrum sp.]|nr:efflux RND transporter periplasmic adaptor subunit [Candidatus Acidoferrum sp.]
MRKIVNPDGGQAAPMYLGRAVGKGGPLIGHLGWRTWIFVAFGAFTLGTCAGCRQQVSSASAQKPPQVEVAQVIQKDVRVYGEWVATLDGYVNAQIQPQVTGYLIKQEYREGSFVHQGDVLFEIDPRPFQAVLDQAKAQLAQAEAQLGNATINVSRDVPEAQENAIPQSQLDTDKQSQLAGKAAVEAGQAAVEQASLNLGFTKVRSLISGIAGIAQVQVGNLVSPSTVLTAVSQVNPIKVYFPISGDDYLRMVGGARQGSVDLLSASSNVPLQLILSDGSTYPRLGRFLFADRQIDQQTGTIRIASSFPNPGNILRPGEYGRVRAPTAIRKGALMIPQRAVTELQGSYQVAVVEEGNKVAIRSVEVGQRVGTMWVINKGIAAGEQVVAEGTLKVRDGSVVTPVPYNPAGATQ